jgi:hypothetical protein
MAGQPSDINSLHRHKMMRREILIADRTELHLTWIASAVYLKPLPQFLLDGTFFRERLLGTGSPRMSSTLRSASCGRTQS